jgi:hypothetical protein
VLIREQYFFIHDDLSEECPAGIFSHGLFIHLIPFLRKRKENTFWKYNKEQGVFLKLNKNTTGDKI